MQPETHTNTRVFLAVSAGALVIANVIQGALEIVLALPFGINFSTSHISHISKYLMNFPDRQVAI